MKIATKFFSQCAVLFSLTLSLPARGEVLSLVTGECEPLSGEKLPGGGFATMIVKRAFEKAGFTIKLSFLPWARGYQEAMHNKVLGTFPYASTVERRQDFLYSDALYAVRVAIFTSAKKKINFQKSEDLKGLTIVVPLGYSTLSLTPMVERRELKVERTKDLTGAFKMLDSGRADFLVLMETVGWLEVEKAFGNRLGFRVLDKPLEELSDHFIISRSYPKAQEYIDKMNESLAAMKKSGEIDQLVQENFH